MLPIWLWPLSAFLLVLMGLIASYSIYRAVRASTVQRFGSGAELARRQQQLARLFRWLVVECVITGCGLSLGDARWLGAELPLTVWLSIVALTFSAGFIVWGFTLTALQRAGQD